MMMIDLRNDFHNSVASVRVPRGGLLSQRQMRRICRKLCGLAGCQCGGIRGPQPGIPAGMIIDPDANPGMIRIIAR